MCRAGCVSGIDLLTIEQVQEMMEKAGYPGCHRRTKITRLRERIQADQYHPPAEQLAQDIITHDQSRKPSTPTIYYPISPRRPCRPH